MFFYCIIECMDVINMPPPPTHTHPQGKHPTLGTHHAKFTNYTFDLEEFMRISTSLGEEVRQRKMAYLGAKDSTIHTHNEL